MDALKQISIVIPAYNRAHLIGETLDSFLAQTYTNWECLIVDDGSTDTTVEVIDHYTQKDERFKLFIRPNSKPKGANACRNIGLKNASGDYVVFFDSDDLMTPDHLQVKLNAIENSTFDYVITKTEYFNYETDRHDKYYKFDAFDFTPYNYVVQNINWLTLDVCIKAALAKSIWFNEQLQSGQEYNFFCKLVHKSVNAGFVDRVVSLRRHHEGSIRFNLKSSTKKKQINRFNRSWFTYLDLKTVAQREALVFLMTNCITTCYDAKAIPFFDKGTFIKELLKFYGLKGVYFLGLILSLKYFNLGYSFRHYYLKS